MPDAASWRTVCTFRDARGFTALTTFHVVKDISLNPEFNAQAILDTLYPLSNASLNRATGLVSTPPTAPALGTAAPFLSVSDKALMTFTTASGEVGEILVPAPLEALFLADGETIDPANALVIDWTTAMLANFAGTRAGNLFITWWGGRLVRTTRPRRLNTYTLAPNLATPGW